MHSHSSVCVCSYNVSWMNLFCLITKFGHVQKIVIYGKGELPDRDTINESAVCRAQLIHLLLRDCSYSKQFHCHIIFSAHIQWYNNQWLWWRISHLITNINHFFFFFLRMKTYLNIFFPLKNTFIAHWHITLKCYKTWSVLIYLLPFLLYVEFCESTLSTRTFCIPSHTVTLSS